MSIILISMTQTNWSELSRLGQNIIERNITSPIEEKNIPLQSPAAFIAALGQLQNRLNVVDLLRKPKELARHVMLTFMCLIESQIVFDIMLHSKLDILEINEHRNIYIITGNAEVWQDSIICFAQKDSRLEGFALQMIHQLDKVGLSYLFDEYSRKTSPRGLMLIKK